MSTSNWMDLQTLGFQLIIMPKISLITEANTPTYTGGSEQCLPVHCRPPPVCVGGPIRFFLRRYVTRLAFVQFNMFVRVATPSKFVLQCWLCRFSQIATPVLSNCVSQLHGFLVNNFYWFWPRAELSVSLLNFLTFTTLSLGGCVHITRLHIQEFVEGLMKLVTIFMHGSLITIIISRSCP